MEGAPAWRAPVADGPVTGSVVVPGSKSATARALVLAALADAPGTITGGLTARDSTLMIDALRALGATIDTSAAVWTVTPGPVRAGATIDCGLAGTVMRFVPPVAALGHGVTRFIGDPAASARPVAPLLDGLRQLGARIDDDTLPFSVTGPLTSGVATIDATGSSQFVSGLLLAGARFPSGLTLHHRGGSVPSRPHITLTSAMLTGRGVTVHQPDPDTWVVRAGPIAATAEVVEPDLTTAAVFLAAALVTGGSVTIPGWPDASTQPGAATPEILARFGGTLTYAGGGVTLTGTSHLRGVDLDLHETSELTPVVAALAALADGPSVLRGVGHIRGHEADRLAALATGITALGGACAETEDGLSITSPVRTGGVWACHADHRLAHAGALLGLRTPGVVLDDVGCTSKTMPTFPAAWLDLVSR